MADNTDEEHLDNPINTQLNIPSDDIIPTQDTATINPNQETENMEVHKHPHHVTHKKKWKEYLLEFFMLFLAVFCGFLAEYQLEHIIEKDKEKQYIESLGRDVNDDIKFINEHYKQWQNNYNSSDSLAKIFESNEIIKKPELAISLMPEVIGFADFVSSDGTIQQLMNSGGLRLIRKRDVVDSIMAYQKQIEIIKNFQNGMNQYQQNSRQLTDIFDFVANANFANTKNVSLLSSDKKSLNTAYVYVINWRKKFHWLLIYADAIKQHAEGLLGVIHKYYFI